MSRREMAPNLAELHKQVVFGQSNGKIVSSRNIQTSISGWQFPQTRKRDVCQKSNHYAKKLQRHHQQFLARATEELSQDKFDEGIWLDNFKDVFKSLKSGFYYLWLPQVSN